MLSRHKGDSYRDLDRHILLHRYNWEEFERNFLALARKGVFAPTFILVLAYVLYGAGIVLFGIDRLLLLWSQSFAVLILVMPSAFLALLTAVILHLSLAWSLFQAGAHNASAKLVVQVLCAWCLRTVEQA
jgi:hypothetical protein